MSLLSSEILQILFKAVFIRRCDSSDFSHNVRLFPVFISIQYTSRQLIDCFCFPPLISPRPPGCWEFRESCWAGKHCCQSLNWKLNERLPRYRTQLARRPFLTQCVTTAVSLAYAGAICLHAKPRLVSLRDWRCHGTTASGKDWV